MERGEQLSALLDGELDELSTARLLDSAAPGGDGMAAWEEYALIGELLREGEAARLAGSAGARRALAEIAHEPAPRRPWSTRLPAWRPAVPWAMAASVALVVFLFSASGATPVLLARLQPAGGTHEAEYLAGSADPMARYIDYHREVAGPGFERTAFAVSADGGGQGR